VLDLGADFKEGLFVAESDTDFRNFSGISDVRYYRLIFTICSVDHLPSGLIPIRDNQEEIHNACFAMRAIVWRQLTISMVGARLASPNRGTAQRIPQGCDNYLPE
jgi:hypothetical protein